MPSIAPFPPFLYALALAHSSSCIEKSPLLLHEGEAPAGKLVKAPEQSEIKEHGELADGKGKSVLTGIRYGWLRNGQRGDNRESKRRKFNPLTKWHLRTARAWRIKETTSTLWEYSYAGVAARNWKELLSWMMHSRIEEMKKVAKMVREHFWGILNAIRLRTSNGMLEAKNNCIQRIKRIARSLAPTAHFTHSLPGL
jgi:hypothetical protein